MYVILTVELDNPVPNTLEEVPATALLLGHKARLVSLVEVEFQNEVKRGSNNREDDSPSTIGPSPANVVVELFCHFGSRKCGNNIGRRSECVSQGSILQLRNISCNNVDGEFHAAEAKVVKHLDSMSAADSISIARLQLTLAAQ